MKTLLFAVYDSKSKAYMHPHHALTKGEAIRSLDQAVNDPSKKSMIAQYPGDFTLFALGEFDDQKGDYKNYETNERVMTALEMVNETESPILKAIDNNKKENTNVQ